MCVCVYVCVCVCMCVCFGACAYFRACPNLRAFFTQMDGAVDGGKCCSNAVRMELLFYFAVP